MANPLEWWEDEQAPVVGGTPVATPTYTFPTASAGARVVADNV